MRIHATEMSTDHMCRQSPQARSRRAIWSITRRLNEVQWPFLGLIVFMSIVSGTLNHPPEFRKYSKRCGKQGEIR